MSDGTALELSRRDAIAALTAVGVGVGGVAFARSDRNPLASSDEGEPDDVDTMETMLALTDVVYPAEVTATDEFIETYVFGRLEDDAEYVAKIDETARSLEERALDDFSESFGDLSAADREDLLRTAHVNHAEPDPEGTEVERIRYYLVNELLYALFSTPTGSELVGVDNPTGYPGGLDAYQRGPGR